MITQLTYPLTEPQKRIWYMERFYPETGISNIGANISFVTKEPFQPELLKQAIIEYVRLNDTMRLRMINEPGSEPMQYVAEFTSFDIEIVDFSTKTKSDVEQWADEIVRKPMKFFDNDLFFFAISQTSENEGSFIIKVNHILSDGNGMILTISEIIDMYLLLAEGHTIQEGSRPSYLEYIPQEQAYKQSERCAKDKQYWSDKFETLPEFLSLKPTNSYNIQTDAEREIVVIPKELERQVRDFCDTNNISLLTLFLSILYTYCYRITGHEDLVLGTFFANRTNGKEKSLPGMFVSTTPVRVQLDPDSDFISFARSVLKEQTSVLRHQKYPYNTILSDIKSSKSNISSLFGLALEYIVMGWQEKDGISYVVEQVFCGHELNDLFVSIKERWDIDELQMVLDYRTEMFTREEILEISHHMLTLLKDAVTNPIKPIRLLEICPQNQKQLILEHFNQTETPITPGLTAIALFEQQAERVPDQTAVLFGSSRHTYREINERANRLARLLIAKGVTRDSRVAILMERKPLMVECILAIWKAGGAYVPVDPAYPMQRIVDMIGDSQAVCVLTETDFASEELKHLLSGSTFLPLDTMESELTEFESTNVMIEVVPEQLAYLIYTSGSTGKPKGAMLEHAGMLNHIDAMIEVLGMNEDCVMAQNAPHCFDISVWQFVTALTLGGTTVIYPNELILNPRAFISQVEQDGVTVLEVVVSFMSALLEMDLAVQLARLENLLVTGEAAKPELARRWFNRFPSVKLINAYGPTEACDDITLHIMDKAPVDEVMPIGKPVRNMKVYVVDSHMNLMPIGVIGELCVSGIGVGRGYLNDPERTARAFMEDPFQSKPGVRLYRTGDLARWLPDGSLEYMGRIDHQVKIRGHRIECGDIETRLMQHEAIKTVLVLDRTDANGNKYLCAYYTGMWELSSAELREFIAAELPSYMVPSHFISLDIFPLTPNGKIDRRALPEPDADMNSGTAEYTAPRSDAELQLANIWQSVLGIDRIGVRDNFFELGGDSLKAMVIIAHIYKQYGVDLPLRELFEASTVEELAIRLSSYIHSADAKKFSKLVPVEQQEMYEVSSAQKRMFLLHLLEEGSTAYNLPGRLVLEGPLDAEKVSASLKMVVQRHEALRTSFVMMDGVPFQRVHEQIDLEVPVVEAATEELTQLAEQFIRPFQLSEAPLLRVLLVKHSEEQHSLFIDMHHIISDGVSVQLFLQQFAAFYGGARLPELQVQYKDFSAWQNQLLKSELIQNQEAFWLQQLSGELPVLAFPTDYPRPAVQSFAGQRLWFYAGSDLTSAVRRIAADTGTTTFMVMLAAYHTLLFKYTWQEDIIVGTPIAGRSLAELEGVFGMFVNTLSIRAFPEESKTFKQFLSEIKNTLFQAYEHQEYPFDALVEKLELGRDSSRNPIFDMLFVHMNDDIIDMEFEGVKLKVNELDGDIAKFDMMLEASEQSDNIRFKLQYCSDLFSKETMDRLSRHFLALLEAVTANPDAALGSLNMMGEQEKDMLLNELQVANAEYPQTATIVSLFEQQAASTPDRIAVSCEGQALTYRELDERANRLARTLRNCGIGRNSLVAMLVNRSVEMITGILAVIKAGGAYVPIDPSYPADRIQYTLLDSGAAVLLTESEHFALIADYNGIVIDVADEAVYAEDGGSLEHVNEPDDLLYIIYTSGTTGQPKGVMISHRNVVRLLVHDRLQFDFSETDVWTMFHSYCFDFSVWEMYGALLYGGKTVIVPKHVAQNPADFAELLRTEQVTVLNQTPTAFYALIHEEMQKPEQALSIRYVIFGGEALSPAMLRPWREKYPATKLINMYGITETTVHVTYKEIGDDEIAANISNIGKPIPTLTAYIFDKNKQLAPIGVVGELYVGGAGVARGYLNREELTADRFLMNPHVAGERIYRSGDLARMLPNGEMEYLGRIDHQVKIRGYRIELGEIESVLLRMPEIKEAAVLAASDAHGQNILVAYYIAGGSITDADIRVSLSEHLPSYMIPSFFVQLERMPLTSNGKLDRSALPKPQRQSGDSEQILPRTETEERLVTIWKELLGAESIGVTDDFFHSGGHSLSAAMMTARILAEFNTKISLRAVFRHPTIAEIGAAIDAAADSRGAQPEEQAAYIAIKPADELDHYPLSSAQKRLFVLDRLEGASSGTAYNLPAAMLLEGQLELDRLEQAFASMVRRHESLRTSFHLENGVPVQIIHPEVDFAIQRFKADEANIAVAIDSFVRPFDLNKPPLLRVGLAELSDNKHLLLVDMHHIVSDGVSAAVIIDELIRGYAGEKLPQPQLQYKDYAVWQQNWLASDDYSRQEKYWVDALSGELPVLELPYDYQRPPLQSFEGAFFTYTIREELAGKLIELSRETGATLYMLLLAAYKVLLFKYSSSEDIIVGTPVANRPQAETNSMIGMFVNTLAIRSYPSAEQTFESYLKQVMDRTLGAFEHQSYPFEELVDRLAVRRDLSRNPIFDTMFSMNNVNTVELELNKLSFGTVPVDEKISKFDISIEAIEKNSTIEFIVEYCTRLFREQTAQRFAGHFTQILESIVTNPAALLGTIPILTEAEKTQIVKDFNCSDAPIREGVTAISLFEEQAERVPDHVAVRCGDASLTYAELNRRANQLARLLREKGVGRDDRVAIFMDRKPAMVVCILAIWKAGGAYVPVDPAYPLQRITDMIGDSEAVCVLTETVFCTNEIQAALPKPTYLCLDALSDSLERFEGHNLELVVEPEQLAYVLYTSGSTGKPKGAMLEHAGMLNHIEAMIEELHMEEGCVLAQNAPHCFDISVWQFVTALTIGGTTAIYPNELIANPRAFIAAVARDGVTVLEIVVSFMSALLEMDIDESLPALEHLIITGEAAKAQLARQWFERYPHVKLVNAYGPTEAADDITLHILDRAPETDSMPIGRPVRNMKVYVADRDLNLLPIGVIGELCVAGIGVGRGYLNDPERTAKAFTEDPFQETKGVRLYRTGDLARWLPDGNLEYMGRIDHQVKIRGHRIECGEIEARLLEHEAIKQTLVMDLTDNRGQKYLCAYYTADSELDAAALKQFVGEALPSYMVPAFLIQLEQFPLTPNGKIDRKALPKPAGDPVAAEYIAPRSETERLLAEIWQNVLGISRVGIRDHFFELGGHSLKAMVMLSHVSGKWGVDVPLRELFAAPTVEGLSQALHALVQSEQQVEKHIPVVPQQAMYPLSSEQKRMYILSQFEEGGSTSYHMSDALRIDGPLDKEKLRAAFRAIVRRHDVLRTSFHSVDGEPFQKVDDSLELELPVRQIAEHEAADIVRQFVRPFQLDQAPLLRMELLQLSETQHILLIDMHHIVSDGESIRLIVDEFIRLYSGIELADLSIQYKDFADWQNKRQASIFMKRQEEYWLNRFANDEVPVLQLPTDYARPAVQSFEGDRLAIHADSKLLEELRQLAKNTGTTMYMILLTAYHIMLSKYSGQRDIVIGTPVAGRTHADVHPLVGMFVNTLAIRCQNDPGMTFQELLEQVKQRSLEAFENQEYPFEALVDQLKLKRDFSRNPLFDTMFSHQMSDTEALAVAELTFTPYEMDNLTSKFDLSLDAIETADSLQFEWEFSTKLFNKETIARTAGHFVKLVREAASNPQQRIADMDMVTEEEKQLLLQDFNATKRDYPTGLTFHEQFERQALLSPEHIAVTAEGRSLTYRELNARANRLAHVLRSKGVGPESIVGIMVGRSVDMIAAALGVMKAGGAYLPIDPEYPNDRIAYLIKDSKAAVVIVQHDLLDSSVELSGEIVILEEVVENGGDESNPINETKDHHLAYIIYTSGTTGNPKGVMIEHRQYMNVALAWKEKYELEQFPVRLLQMASFSFDVFAGDMARALLSGGQLVICPNDVKLDPASLYELIARHGVNIFESTPALIAPLMQHIYEHGLDISSLRLLILGADNCPIEEFRKLLSRYGKQMRIINSYGVTEAAIDSSYYEETLENLPAAGNTPIGKPLPNMSYYVLDEALRLLPVGVAGELYIGGAGVARGYLGRMDLTAEKFIDNPYVPGERLYRTGDLSKWMADGNLMFLGRDDHQVKVRGYRIELGEIEACLLKHPHIREAVVVAFEDAYAQKYLCAYIVGTSKPSLEELQAHMNGELPVYMVPSQIVVLEKMPLTPNGKIDRKAMPEPTGLQLKSTEYVAPSTVTEKRLVEVMELVLGTSGIGMNDDFFQLGGHSLKAMALVSHIHKAFGVAIPLRQIFEAPTAAHMSRFIDTVEANTETNYAAIEPIVEQESYELSSVQKRMFILDQIEGTGTSYNMPDAMLLEGNIDPVRVEEALRRLIDRHESLRTSFHMQNGTAVQQVHAKVEFHVEFSEALNASAEELEKVTARFVRPFDLGLAPLMRAGLVKLARDRYLFLFDVHHIVSDGLSMGIIVSEFAALYAGEELPELRLQYKDFAAWQNRQFTPEYLRKQEAFWQQSLSGELPVLELPTDYPRPALQSFEGARIAFGSGMELRDALNRFATETGTTLYMVLFAAYNVLLAKYSGQSDIIVGTATAGRSHADLEGVVGMFVGTLAIRTELDTERSFRELLEDVKVRMLQAYDHQDYPFDQLVEKLNVKRDLSRNPVFDTMFILQNTDEQRFQLEDITISPFETKETMTKFDLTLEATETENDIAFVLEYSSRLFHPETVERMSKHLVQLIQSATSKPDTPICELGILSEQEERLLTAGFNDTEAIYTDAELLHELVEQQVSRTPNQPAIIAGNASVTYQQWNEQANKLARTLRASGAGSDRTVAVLAKRSIPMAVAILAVLKSGAAYVPIDPDYPLERIRYLLEDSGSFLLLTQGELPDGLTYEGLTLDLQDNASYSSDGSNLEHVNSPQDLAYIIYTSGTTGKPKGVMIEHRSIVNTICWRRDEYGFGPQDRVLQLLSYAFDAFVASFFAPMSAGSASVIAGEDEAKDPLALKGIITSHRITHFSTVPSLYAALLDMLSPDEAVHLKAITLGGEHVPLSLVEKSVALNTELLLFNEYGPTESSVIATIQSGLKPNKRITIGHPIANTRVYIVDSHMNLQPIGVFGELCIGGTGLARGYLNEPEMTAAKFVASSFGKGETVYRTGDMARWLEDGTLDFAGRIDHQVKIRGYRIELGEIEANLLKHEWIKEAVVIARDDDSGQKYLCAYIVSDDELAVLDIRAGMARELPGYMVPSYFIQLPQLPLTPNGKLDMKALPAPDLDRMGDSYYSAPSDELEEKLAAMIQQLLQLDRVGMSDNFFAIGGQSLKAMQLVAQLYREYKAEVPLRIIFETNAIRDIAEFIRSAISAENTALRPAEQREHYPLSSAQKRLFVLDQLEGPGTGYNMPGVVRLNGLLDRYRLEEAFKQLINRHEMLRTTFHTADSEPIQIIHDTAELELEWMEAYEHETLSLIEAFVRPFELSQAPLLRVGLIKLKEEEHLLLFDTHHIVSDGISMNVLIYELTELYKGAELNELKVQYKDFAVWQQGLFQSGAMEKQEAYWLERFGGDIPVLELPADYVRPAVRSLAGEYFDFEADEQLLQELQRLAASTGTTLFMVLLAAYNVLLAKYTNQEDIVVGTPIAGRTHGDTEGLIGMFVSTLPMRNQPESGKTFLDFLSEVKQHAYEAYENQDYPFESIVDKVQPHRDLSRNPLFDTVFTMQNMDQSALEMDQIHIEPYEYENKISKFDLTLAAIEENGRLALSWEYCTALFRSETIERLAKHYVQTLKEITKHPERTLTHIQMLDENEKEQLLFSFNETGKVQPPIDTMHGLFERQAAAVPKHIALTLGSEQMTYEELNAKANQLARTLRIRGIGSEAVVGIMANRSFEMIIGMLAVWKAGGAYMPIDPAYPADRIAYMLDNSEAEFVLAHSEYIPASDDEASVVWLDLNDDGLYQAEDGNLPHIGSSSDLAYIIYTSGTTGKPKGVMIEHRSIAGNIWWRKEAYGLSTADRVLQLFSFAFDGFVTSFYTPLVSGATIVLLEEDEAKDPLAIKQSIVKHAVTHFISVPSLYSGILECLSGKEATSLRMITLAGERVTDKIVSQSKAVNESIELINEYGPTESSVVATIERDLQPGRLITIGRPISGTRIRILDAAGQMVPIGAIGELCIAGDGLSRGYVKLPEMNAERFINDPYEPQSRLYRTGDAARWLPDGRIDYIGRIDDQVKVRGYRIELGEIEGALLKLNSVKEAVVVARDDHGGQKYLCAYVTAADEFDITTAREELSANLPDYMVPSFIVKLERLPVTPNGKVDRRALPEPDRAGGAADAYVAPANEREQILADIWKDVLGAGQVGTRDHFFQLGGDSIKAIQAAARLNKYGLRFEVRDLFRYPTIAELSQRLTAIERTISQEAVEGEVPLTPIQRWFFENRFVHEHFWNQAELIHRPDGFDADVLHQAFVKLTEHHDALRLRFDADGSGNVTQHNAGTKGQHFTLEQYDLRGQSKEYIRQALLERSTLIQSGMCLNTGPLVKLGLFLTDDGDHLLIAIHHLAVDGVSWRILFEDLEEAYRLASLGEEIIFPEKTDSYRYWAQQLEAYAQSERLRNEISYWSKLSESPVTLLPKDKQGSDNRVKHMRSAAGELPLEATEKLLKKANEAYRTEINDLLMSALALALKDWSGGHAFAVNLEGHGRESFVEQLDITRTVGWFTSQFPVILDASHADDLGYLIKLTKETLRKVPNKGIGYGILKYMTDALPDGGFIPELSFNYLGQFDGTESDGSLKASYYDAGLPFSIESQRTASLDITGIVTEGRLRLELHYSSEQYETATAQLLMERLVNRLLEIIEYCVSRDTQELTPSDLGDEELTLEELDDLLESIEF